MEFRLKELLHRLWLKKIDWYIIKKFLGTYFFSIALIIIICMVFDYNEHIDKLKEAPLKAVLIDYYLNFIPYFANMFSSLFVFITIIFFTSKLAENSEIIAMFSTGLSFKRMMIPYMLSAAFIAMLSLYLGSQVIPKSNAVRIEFENRYMNKSRDYNDSRNIQLKISDNVIFYLERYEEYNNTGYRFCLDKFDGKKLVEHMTARTIVYDTIAREKYHWTAKNFMIRHLVDNNESMFQGAELDTIIPIEPADFLVSRGQQETMTTSELKEYIVRQKERGIEDIREFEIEYHKRYALSFASFILTAIGVSLSSRKRKGGMGLYLGIGLGLSFGYILFQEVSSTFAVSGVMSAFWAEWLPNIIYLFVAVYLYIKAPK